MKTQRHRQVSEIVCDILDSIAAGVKKATHLTFQCNLDSRCIIKYLKMLIDNGYIEQVRISESKSKYEYVVTEKGRELLFFLRDVNSRMKDIYEAV